MKDTDKELNDGLSIRDKIIDALIAITTEASEKKIGTACFISGVIQGFTEFLGAHAKSINLSEDDVDGYVDDVTQIISESLVSYINKATSSETK